MTNEKQMECRYLTPNIQKLRVKVLEVIGLVIPDEKNEYVCALNSISQPKDTYKHSDYQTVAKWRERTVAHTIEYLKLNCPTCYFTSEHLRLFTTYLFGILLRSRYPDKYLTEALSKYPNSNLTDNGQYAYFIIHHLLHPDCIDNPREYQKMVISQNDMSVFFCLFLDVSKCFEGSTTYKLTEIQRSKVEALISQTDISLRESFRRLVRIFFPEN